MKKLIATIAIITLAACGGGVSTDIKADSTHVDTTKDGVVNQIDTTKQIDTLK
jgi:hypothetical protein